MKKLILLELAFLFLATTFSSNPPPPGWYQQTLPVNDFVNDIFFLDSLKGWIVTTSSLSINDTGYIMQTTNGGFDWYITFQGIIDFTAIQFLDLNIGYACGSDIHTRFLKSTNGGVNWIDLNILSSTYLKDLFFINKDSGWVTSTDPFDGGVFKTTNGGMNWQRQLNYGVYNPQVVFFINKDTGWIGNDNNRLYKTINGGQNWDLEIIFPGTGAQINDIYFFNGSTGFVSSGRIYKTTNGGISWDTANDGGIKLSFANDSVGWAGANLTNIRKTTNGGLFWFRQTTNANNPTPFAITNTNAWAGGNILVHTTDGGPPSGIKNTNKNISDNYILFQNYPNPFNPTTTINYELKKMGFVKLNVYNSAGKVIKDLVNKSQIAGNYKINFYGNDLPSGVYFYQIEIKSDKSNEVFTDTKKMILIK